VLLVAKALGYLRAVTSSPHGALFKAAFSSPEQ